MYTPEQLREWYEALKRAGWVGVETAGVVVPFVDSIRAHAAKIEECERVKRVLRELLEATLSKMPPYEAGKDAQDAWADRCAKARNDATAMLAALKGEPK